MKVVVIGAQWGDEGKGKIVDFLAEQSDLVVRFSGGANAGHTVVLRDKTYKLHLVPSGVVYENKQVVMGSGMVIDPESLFNELATLEEQGITWQGRVFISDRAHVVLPEYKEIDKQMDSKRRNPIGTTGRGIGVAYAQKANRDGIRIGDLNDNEFLTSLRPNEREFLTPYIDRLRTMSINLAEFMQNYSNEKILYEGAQGVLLDIDVGSYPYVSSGCSAAAGASLGGAIGPRSIDQVLGVFKAYSTRVGNGPFPSEFTQERDGDLGDTIREIGHEYGVTTGRPRRCGYLDLVAMRYACQTNSIDSLVLTHPDVYDTFEEVSVCVAYKIDGQETTSFPSSARKLERAEPVLKKFPGWKKSITAATSFDELPENCRTYISFIEEYTGTAVGIISVGPDRTQTFIRKKVW
ncbi:MAG: adenylosuccinate synthetase [Spirochaetaceae bacterium]|nr:adenylosuccinate synthetase [Spirochaetaceae bacterium]MCF7948193.1 adenylosuccinate synthetase [Spirochaetia bacterium]MCF7950809.1 adenylosuccinate synthetase [Spirochaetaceae bacterium]